jgi:CPA1 family monovalent cation:H+ antiporter
MYSKADLADAKGNTRSLAPQTALQRVLQHLETIEKSPGIDPEFYRYQKALVQVKISK